MTVTNKINLSLIALALIFLFLIFFLIFPLFSEIKKNSQELIVQKEALSSFEAKIESLIGFKAEHEEIKLSLEKISDLFVDSKAPVDFIAFLEREAESCGVKIKISSVVPLVIKEDPWPSFSFGVMTTSSPSQFFKFFQKLEFSPYLIEIENLSIKRLDEKDLELKEFEEYFLGDIRVNFSFKVFAN